MSQPVTAELLGQLLDEHGPALALYAAQWTSAADDCVQEALVALAGQPHVPENAAAWLYRVVKHRALNASRADRRRREREQRSLQTRLTASERLPDGVDVVALVDAVEQLEEPLPEIVVMRIWGNLSLAEIADATELSVSTVHRKYQQALSHLRTIWEVPCPTNKTESRG